MAERDPEFLRRLAERTRTKKRAFVAQEKSALYPTRPDLQDMSRPIGDGYWLATNNSTARKEKLVAIAAEIAGLPLGGDLKVRFEK